MRHNRLLTMAMMGILSCTGLALAQPAPVPTEPATPSEQPAQVDNPQYKAWKNFEVGSNQTMESTMTSNGQKMKMTTTQELSEKKADEVTITISGEMEMMGQKQTMPPQKQKVPAKAPEQKMKELGHEKVTVAGETFDATVYEMETGNGTTAKVWFSEKVPGGVVQVTMSNPQGELKGELTKYQAK